MISRPRDPQFCWYHLWLVGKIYSLELSAYIGVEKSLDTLSCSFQGNTSEEQDDENNIWKGSGEVHNLLVRQNFNVSVRASIMLYPVI